MTTLGACRHCGVGTLASSIGPVHADTHNGHSDVNGYHAASPVYAGQVPAPLTEALES